ncbi:hypothetical protein SO694_00069188 [Aureococcus anophagefferens]|uniref:ABC transporter domain-containing protein n=1 Tax=Aureococcus anophagefferens TaxID=44056 RepID=A0ABR1FQ35_AURAN
MGLISVAYAAVSSDMVAIPLSAGFGRVALHGDRESRPRLWAEAALIAAVAYHNGLAVLGGNGAGPWRDFGATVALQCLDLTLERHAGNLETSASRCYQLVSRKVFSLPKLLLLPAIVAQHPSPSRAALPGFLAVDGLKARFLAALTSAIEEKRRESAKLASTPSKVEAHGVAAPGFTHRGRGGDGLHAVPLGVSQRRRRAAQAEASALETVRRYFRWLYWSDFLTPLIEVARQALLEHDLIETPDVWLMARALEDALDTLLTRSRAEAELGELATDDVRTAPRAPREWLATRAPRAVSENETLAIVDGLFTDLDFYASTSNVSDLARDHDDFAGGLSGGQKVKFELVRQLFLPAALGAPCPGLLLLDEIFSPLDPASKAAVRSRLKRACPDAITLAIYHHDAGACVPPADFFTDVLHFGKQPDDTMAVARVRTC